MECFWYTASVQECRRALVPVTISPIALLSVNSKLFKAIINNKVTEYFNKNKHLSNKHYDFRFSRPTADVLIIIKNWISETLHNKKICESDCPKYHEGILQCGVQSIATQTWISRTVFSIIKSFLSGRSMKVVINEAHQINVGAPKAFSSVLPSFYLY